ncbi:MAG TPA: hypothetical protein VKT73_09700 [Xanthobacteraceae bacterium]|nr:hypothetical protein [Xanthobacteraceae bacterium]
MGALQPTSLAEAIAAADLVQLRRYRNPEQSISRAEAEALLALDRLEQNGAASWRDFIAGAIADHLASTPPLETINEEKSTWLISAIAPGGDIETVTGFETLLRVMEAAREVPAALAVFAISQLRSAITTGEGAAIGPRAHFSRIVDAEDAVLLYRILVAAGGAAGVPVSREEAEALFDLHDATARSENDPAFDNLFYRAIAHHALAASGEAVATRSLALAPDGTLTNAAPNAEQAAWLSERIMRDGRPTLAEFELLRFLGAEAPQPNRSIRRLLDSAA